MEPPPSHSGENGIRNPFLLPNLAVDAGFHDHAQRRGRGESLDHMYMLECLAAYDKANAWTCYCTDGETVPQSEILYVCSIAIQACFKCTEIGDPKHKRNVFQILLGWFRPQVKAKGWILPPSFLYAHEYEAILGSAQACKESEHHRSYHCAFWYKDIARSCCSWSPVIPVVIVITPYPSCPEILHQQSAKWSVVMKQMFHEYINGRRQWRTWLPF